MGRIGTLLATRVYGFVGLVYGLLSWLAVMFFWIATRFTFAQSAIQRYHPFTV